MKPTTVENQLQHWQSLESKVEHRADLAPFEHKALDFYRRHFGNKPLPAAIAD